MRAGARRLKGQPTGYQCGAYLARQFIAAKRRVLALAAQRLGLHLPRHLRVKHANIGRAADMQPPYKEAMLTLDPLYLYTQGP